MELHGFHVAERRDAGLERDRRADAFADHGVGRHAVEPAGAAGRDRRRLCHVSAQLAGDQAAHDRAVAAAAFVDQRDRLHALVHRDRLGDRPVAHRVQHGVAGAVGDVAGAPLLGAAEVALRDQAVGLVALGERDLLAVDDHLPVAARDPAPRHAPGGQLAHRLRRGVDEHADDALVSAPVAASHRVLEVDVLVVALPLMTLPSDACMPPWAAAECERFGGTSERMIASWPRRFAPIATRSPARPPPITSTSV